MGVIFTCPGCGRPTDVSIPVATEKLRIGGGKGSLAIVYLCPDCARITMAEKLRKARPSS